MSLIVLCYKKLLLLLLSDLLLCNSCASPNLSVFSECHCFLRAFSISICLLQLLSLSPLVSNYLSFCLSFYSAVLSVPQFLYLDSFYWMVMAELYHVDKYNLLIWLFGYIVSIISGCLVYNFILFTVSL